MIDSIYTRESFNTMKPDPEFLGGVLKKENLNKDEVVVIGDSTIDMKSAVNCGIKAIGVLGTMSKEKLLEAGASMVAKDLYELEKILEDI